MGNDNNRPFLPIVGIVLIILFFQDKLAPPPSAIDINAEPIGAVCDIRSSQIDYYLVCATIFVVPDFLFCVYIDDGDDGWRTL